jgi:hypothetical protein
MPKAHFRLLPRSNTGVALLLSSGCCLPVPLYFFALALSTISEDSAGVKRANTYLYWKQMSCEMPLCGLLGDNGDRVAGDERVVMNADGSFEPFVEFFDRLVVGDATQLILPHALVGAQDWICPLQYIRLICNPQKISHGLSVTVISSLGSHGFVAQFEQLVRCWSAFALSGAFISCLVVFSLRIKTNFLQPRCMVITDSGMF